MHLKPVKSPPRAGGKRHTYYLLVQSVRGPNGKPRHEVLLSVGKLDFSRDDVKRLGRRVTEIVKGQKERLFPERPEIEAKAQEIAEAYVAKRLKEKQKAVTVTEAESGDKQTATVVLDEVDVQHARTVGAEYALLSAWRLLKLDEALKEVHFTKRQQEVAALLVVGRAMSTGSERSTLRWAQKESALDELLGTEFQHLSPKMLYQTSEALWRHKEALELFLRDREQSAFGLRETVFLYDLTNTYFEGQVSEHPGAKRGRSKEKRHDRPLLTLGLVLDGDGFIKRSEIFSGNVSEPATLLEMVEALETKTKESHPEATVVMDAGIATQENLKLLRERGYHYVAVSRRRPVDIETDEGVWVKLEAKDGGLRAQVVRSDGDEVVVLYHSDKREAKERAIRKLKQERFEAALEQLNAGLSRPQTVKRMDKVLERIGRLRERYASVAQFYDIEVTEQDGKAVAIRYGIRDEARLESRFGGTYHMLSSHTDWDEKRIHEVYKLLTGVEDTFRVIKAETELRPNFHRKPERIDAHVFLSVLAFHLIHALRYQLKQRGLTQRWSTIRRILNTQSRVTVRLQKTDGRVVYLRLTLRPTDEQTLIYRALGLNPRPLRLKKFLP